jgi:hypothetical protein
MLDAQFEEGPCDVCRKPVDDCICPECPKCKAQGDPKCYAEIRVKRGRRKPHGLVLSLDQKISRQKMEVEFTKDKVCEEQQYLDLLEAEKYGTGR